MSVFYHVLAPSSIKGKKSDKNLKNTLQYTFKCDTINTINFENAKKETLFSET